FAVTVAGAGRQGTRARDGDGEVSPLWSREDAPDPWLVSFLAGEDHVLDRRLVPYDCRASAAHARMLRAIGILDDDELARLEGTLGEIRSLAERGEFPITPQDEDGHTAIEEFLTARCGDAGRKIHTARSRNDQVLTALRLWEKEQLARIIDGVEAYIDAMDVVCDRQGQVGMPGYTHMQRAMPTTVATWLGSFADAARDDLEVLELALRQVDRCPLGTAAGFGVPVLPIDRDRVARDLGFAEVLENPMHAQLSRGRVEALVLSACGQVMHGLNRLASDLLLFTTREFAFAELPASLCTGSSIMPQKRNADVLELIRASYHVVRGEEAKLHGITANLSSGYHRDLQLTKGPLFAGVDATRGSLRAMGLVLHGVRMNEAACEAALTGELYATERALELVAKGVPFREAYSRVAKEEAERRRADAARAES
ncbi:argininosuccinate lyase, partial [bacterium]|nr:argininosuccinate lyase [bacterium]